MNLSPRQSSGDASRCPVSPSALPLTANPRRPVFADVCHFIENMAFVLRVSWYANC